jgi:hypothetical protein
MTGMAMADKGMQCGVRMSPLLGYFMSSLTLPSMALVHIS